MPNADRNPNLFEPFDPRAVKPGDLIKTSEVTDAYHVSIAWLYERMQPRGPLHRIEISGDRERYFLRSEIEYLRQPRVSGQDYPAPPAS